MTDNGIDALLIEDDVRFAELLLAWLEDLSPVGVHCSLHLPLTLHHVHSLTEALAWLAEKKPDILIADLNLPDSQGLETCHQLLAHESGVPVIVLSGLDDESMAMQAVRRGAQDYLVKSLLDGPMLLRAVRYALERSRLQWELEQARQAQVRLREQESMDRLNERSPTPVSARTLGVQTLDIEQREYFPRLAERLAAILEQVLEMRTHKVNYPISQRLRELAQEMGALKCGPRDVVSIYRAALAGVERPGNLLRNEVLHDEGRYLAFELMGNLVTYYRPYALGGLGRAPVPDSSPPDGSHRRGATPPQG